MTYALTKNDLHVVLGKRYIRLSLDRPNMKVSRRHFPPWDSSVFAPRLKGKGRLRPHSAHTGARTAPVFAAGELVRETGIYEVIHDHAHRDTHEVVLLSDTTFPDCDTCGEQVRFRLVRTAPYIFQDEDFEETE